MEYREFFKKLDGEPHGSVLALGQILAGLPPVGHNGNVTPRWSPAHFRHTAAGGPGEPASVARPPPILDVADVTAIEPRAGETR